MRRSLLLLGFIAVFASLGPISPSEAAGPWRGQVVDAETGEPLEGVIVVAVWDKMSPGVMHPRREYYDVDEVVTDAEGRFVIPARHVLTANPFISLDGPKLQMFKAGYGHPRERGLPRFYDIDDLRRLMAKKGVVFELPTVKSREERRRALPSPPSGPSETQIPRFMDAIEEEAKILGLPPLRTKPSGG